MATIIDALVVTLGLDPTAFKKASKESDDALDRTKAKANATGAATANAGTQSAKGSQKAAAGNKDVEATGKKAGEAIAKLRNEVLRMAAVFVGLSAIKSFVSSVTQSDAAVGRMARNLDMSSENLSAWQGVANRAGGSAESMAGDLRGLSQAVQRFSLTGEGGEVFKYFRAIGVAVTDANGKMLPFDDILLKVSDKFKGMDPAKAQALGAGMGFSEGTINVLMQGRAALTQMLEEQRRANVLTAEDAKNATDRNNAWRLLTDTFGRLARDILNDVTPALVGLMNMIREHAGAAAIIMGSLAAAMTAVSLVRFGTMLGSIAQLGGAFGAVAGQGGLLVAVLGRLGLIGAVGAGAFGITRAISGMTGLDGFMSNIGGAIYDMVHGNDGPSMAGPGQGGAAPARSGSTDASTAAKQSTLRSLESRFGLPAGLLDSVWAQESGRGTDPRSRVENGAHALGDFQFIPGTAKQYGVDRSSFESSALGAARMFADLLKQFHGNVPEALASYNWGSRKLTQYGLANAPAETQKYMREITGRMRTAQASASTSTTEVNVDTINVHTLANDAPGIARDIHSALANQAMATQANTGLF